MKPLAILVAGLILASTQPYAAGLLRPLSGSIDMYKQFFDAGEYERIISRLSPEAMQKFRGEDLKLAYFYLGASYERSRRMDKALGVYQLGVKLFPKDINLLTRLASLLHHTGLEEQAQPLFERVLQIHPNNAAAHLGLAEIDHALGFLESSAKHYEKALETLSNPEFWRNYAEVLLKQRNFGAAEVAIGKALAIGREADPNAMIDLAFIQRGAGRLDEALATLEKLRVEQPKRIDIALTQALWLLEKGRFNQARSRAEEVLNGDPFNPLARWIRAMVHLKTGRQGQAIEDLETASEGFRQAPLVAQASAVFLVQLRGHR